MSTKKSTPNTTFHDFRIKLDRKYAGDLPELASGKGKYYLFKFNPEKFDEKTVRNIANKVYSEGYKVEAFELSKVDGSWVRRDFAKVNKVQSKKNVVVPVGASDERVEKLEKRMDNIEKSVADLAKQMKKVLQALNK